MTFTGSPETGSAIMAACAREPDPAAPGAGRQVAADRPRRRRPRPGGAGDRGAASPSTPARSAPPARGCSSAAGAAASWWSGSPSAFERPRRPLARGRPDGAADQRQAGTAGARLPGHRPARRAPRSSPAAASRPATQYDRGFFVEPTIFDRVDTGHADRPGGDLRAGAVGACFDDEDEAMPSPTAPGTG